MLCPVWPADAAAVHSTRVFVLHSYSQEYPWTKGQHRGFVAELARDAERTFSVATEHLDTKRVAYTQAYADFMARYLQEKYRGYAPAVIYVTDDNALSFARTRLPDIFPDVPVIFSGVNDYSVRDLLDPGRVTGVFERKAIAPNLELMRRIAPGPQRILVVGDRSETYRAIEREVKAELSNFPDIDAHFISEGRIDALTEALRARPERFVFLTTLGAVTDASGETLDLRDTISAIVTAGDFTIFSMEDVYLYPGVLGGYVTSGPRQGRAAALLAKRYLAGMALEELVPVQASPNEYVIDESELTRERLSLPPELAVRARIVNAVPTFYETHRNAIVVSLYSMAALFVASLLLTLVLVVRKNRQIASTSARLAEIEDSLTRAQRIAGLGNWDLHLPGETLYWSEGIYRLFGIAPNQFEASYEGFLSRVHPDDRQTLRACVRRALEDGAPYDVFHRIVRPDGEVRTVRENGEVIRDAQGRAVRMIGTVLDVTDQRRAEGALRESEARLRSFFVQSPAGMAVFDRTGRWTRINPMLAAMHGLSPEAHVGRRPSELLPPALADTIEADIAHVIATGEPSINREVSGQLPPGSGPLRHWLYSQFPIDAGEDEPVAVGAVVIETTALMQAEIALRESEEKLSTVIEGFPLVLWAIDRDGVFVLSRGAGLKALGLQPDEVVGKSVYEYYADFPEIIGDIRRVLSGEALVSTRWVGELAFEIQYSPLRDEAGKVTGAIGVAADVTERKQSEDQLAFLANFDPVTELPNRYLFHDRLSQAMRSADRSQERVALLFIDLDHFKTVNDSLGHAAGDELLKQVAKRLNSVVRAGDTVSRLGGDEFTIILESVHDDADAARVAQQLLDQGARPYRLLEADIYITPSIGIAVYPLDGESVESLVMNADAAMYRAKEGGRNNFQFFTKDINVRAQRRLELGNRLRTAIEQREFRLWYQPQVEITSGRVIGFEALLRWPASGPDPIPPSAFVPVLEETGLIMDVGQWVMNEACRWAAHLAEGSGESLIISVNLSPRQFMQKTLHRVVAEALERSGLAPSRLELEITESSLVDPQMNLETIERLKQLGIRLTIDDFGTGYSSLSYLKRFPVDRLKIDSSFVRDVAIDLDDAAIVTAIIGLAHNLGLRVIAEGVETREQVEFLRANGCDQIQGFIAARPMPAQDVAAWLQRWRPSIFAATVPGRAAAPR